MGTLEPLICPLASPAPFMGGRCRRAPCAALTDSLRDRMGASLDACGLPRSRRPQGGEAGEAPRLRQQARTPPPKQMGSISYTPH